MKKFILLLGIVFCSFISFSQEKDSTQYVTNTNAEKLIDKYSEKITASIAAFSEKLKQPAEHVYKVLIKQQVIYSISYSSIFVLTIFLILGFIPFMKYGLSYKEKGYGSNFENNDGLIILAFFWGVLILAGLIAFAVLIPDIVQGFLNPEYGAIKDIISFF